MAYHKNMYEQWYERISAPFRTRPQTARALAFLDKALVALIAAVYLGVLAWLALSGDPRLARAVLVPGIGFVVVSGARVAINAPRPYEAYRIDPLIHKDTQGKSMPSRHLFSACIIACTLLWIEPWWGALAFIACAIVAFCRIIGGVHFPRDVVVALLLAFLCAAIGYILVP